MKVKNNQKSACSIPNAPGYVLMTTLLFMSMLAALVMGVVSRVVVARNAIRMIHNAERARLLARDGIEIIQAQLLYDPQVEKEKNKEQDTAESKHPELKQLLQILNRWQTFTLRQEVDGIDGQLQIYVAAEDGKLNINSLYDFKNKKFVPEAKKILEQFAFEKKTATEEDGFIKALEEFLKKQDRPLEDITQVLANEKIKELAYNFFVMPDDTLQEEKDRVVLSDVFTVHDLKELQPLFLSASLHKALNLQKFPDDQAQRDEYIQKIIDTLPEIITWSQTWNTVLQPLFKKEYSQLPQEYTKRFGGASRASIISVLCYGKIGDVTQCVGALLQRNEEDGRVSFAVQKIYWL